MGRRRENLNLGVGFRTHEFMTGASITSWGLNRLSQSGARSILILRWISCPFDKVVDNPMGIMLSDKEASPLLLEICICNMISLEGGS